MLRKSRHWMLGLAGGLALIAAGCTSSGSVTSDGRPMPPKPRAAPVTPVGAVPNSMTLLVSYKPEDTDGNGFPDLIRAAAALFAQPHPTPVYAEGSFVFTLYRLGEARLPGARPIATWRFSPEQVAAARSRDLYGPSHSFAFSLLDAGGDRLPPSRGDLRGRFEPVGGGPVVYSSDEVRAVLLGRGGDPR